MSEKVEQLYNMVDLIKRGGGPDEEKNLLTWALS